MVASFFDNISLNVSEFVLSNIRHYKNRGGPILLFPSFIIKLCKRTEVKEYLGKTGYPRRHPFAHWRYMARVLLYRVKKEISTWMIWWIMTLILADHLQLCHLRSSQVRWEQSESLCLDCPWGRKSLPSLSISMLHRMTMKGFYQIIRSRDPPSPFLIEPTLPWHGHIKSDEILMTRLKKRRIRESKFSPICGKGWSTYGRS